MNPARTLRIAAFVALFLVPTATRAQSESALFREVLALERFRPTDLSDVQLAGPETLLVLCGDLKPTRAVPEPFDLARKVVRYGGAVLIVGRGVRDIEGFVPDGMSARLTRAADDPGVRRLPVGVDRRYLEPPLAVFGIMASPRHALTAGLGRIASGPASLKPRGDWRDGWDAVAWPAPRTNNDINRGNLAPIDVSILVADGKDPSFRSMVVADPAVLSTSLMARQDTDNLQFAWRAVRWLRAIAPAPREGPTSRSKCLFIEDGAAVTDFEELGVARSASRVPGPPIPNPLDPKFQAALTDAADRALAKLQDEDIPHKLAGGGSDGVVRVLATAATLAGLGWLLYRSRESRRAPPAPPPAARFFVRPDEPAPGSVLFERRERLRAEEWAAPVREYAWAVLRERGLRTPLGVGPMPPVTFTDGWGLGVAADLRAVWEALGPGAPLTLDGWRALEPKLESVREAARAGRFAFTESEAKT